MDDAIYRHRRTWDPEAQRNVTDKYQDSLREASIQLRSGTRFFPLDPNPKDTHTSDIAHALAMKCRYTGHTRVFYSVAEHCVLVSEVLEEMGADLTVQRQGLLHDASEAYLPDVAAPIKPHIKGFKILERRVHDAVAERYDLPTPWPRAIKDVDELLFHYEASCLLDPVDWWERADLMSYEEILRNVRINGWLPLEARNHWIRRYEFLWPGETVQRPL